MWSHGQYFILDEPTIAMGQLGFDRHRWHRWLHFTPFSAAVEIAVMEKAVGTDFQLQRCARRSGCGAPA